MAKRHFGNRTLMALKDEGFLTEQEARELFAGQDFLWRVRFALHKLVGRREDRLLFHHQIRVAELFGFDKADMRITLDVGVQRPEKVDVDVLRAVFPYGQVTVNVTHGGLDVPRPEGTGNPTIMANVALSVGFDMEKRA